MNILEFKERVKKLKKLFDTSLPVINNLIRTAENKAKTDIDNFEKYKKTTKLDITCNDMVSITTYVFDDTGLYIKPEYKHSLKKFTCEFESIFEIRTYIINNFYNIYQFANAEIKKDKIIINNFNYAWFDKNELIDKSFKIYQNGRIDFKYNEDIVYIIEVAKKIINNVYPC